jgi:hypothetical protein
LQQTDEGRERISEYVSIFNKNKIFAGPEPILIHCFDIFPKIENHNCSALATHKGCINVKNIK